MPEAPARPVPAFRRATPADAERVRALVERAYRGEASRQGWTTEADLLDGQRTDVAGVLEAINHPAGCVILAEHAGELVACAQLERLEHAAYFGMFAVAPELQARGFGRRVLVEAERIAASEWGVAEMRMSVISLREELIAWYERLGYRRTGRYKPFPYGDERFGLPRRDDLRFEWLVKPLPAASA